MNPFYLSTKYVIAVLLEPVWEGSEKVGHDYWLCDDWLTEYTHRTFSPLYDLLDGYCNWEDKAFPGLCAQNVELVSELKVRMKLIDELNDIAGTPYSDKQLSKINWERVFRAVQSWRRAEIKRAAAEAKRLLVEEKRRLQLEKEKA